MPDVTDADLIVAPERLARRMGFDLDDPETAPAVLDAAAEALSDAQADVEAYLGLSIVQATLAERVVLPYAGLPDLSTQPVQAVLQVERETDADGHDTGWGVVTYTGGIDGRTIRPIVRYVLAAAANAPGMLRLWRATTSPARESTTISAEGQSISYASATQGGGGEPGSGAPGALPSLASLDRWINLDTLVPPPSRRPLGRHVDLLTGG